MSLSKIVEDYIAHRDIIETEYKGVLVQYYTKLNAINIYAPKGIKVNLFMEIKKHYKDIYENVEVYVNW